MTSKDISKPVDKHLEDFNKFFKERMKSDVSLLNLILSYISKKKGKQIRPMLVFLAADMCGGVTERAFVGATMAELLHIATLIHDDVVDEASQRRGMASINAVWSNKVAVLIGDYLLARGLLTSIGGKEFEFLRATSKAVQRMSEGELLQIQKSKDYTTDEATYYRIISDKTSSLMSSCCEVGALSATEDPKKINAMIEYGENLGMAFQIKDDIFDYQSKSSIIGKPVGNDLKEKKITLPLIEALRNSTSKEAKEIIKTIKNGELKKKEISHIIEYVVSKGGIDYSLNKAREFANNAKNAITFFDDCDSKQSLLNLTTFVIDRIK